MRKTIFALALGAWLFALSVSAQAQQSGKIFRIGYLDSGTGSGSKVHLDSFRQELSNLGWTEGKTVAFEYRFGEFKGPEPVFALAADLVRLKVDMIVTAGAPAAIEAKRATTTIPIVMATFPDPVALGLIASLARPGVNVTGLTGLSPELNTKRLEVLKDAVPKVARVGLLLVSGGTQTAESQVKELRPAAAALKLKLEEIEIQRAEKNLENAFQTAKQKQVGAIMTISTRFFFAERKRLVELAGKFRLQAIYYDRAFVDEGGLLSYGVNFEDQFRKAAHYVDKILKGAKPADLPVQQPTKFEFIINLKAAKQIGLTIPPNVLVRADRVIK